MDITGMVPTGRGGEVIFVLMTVILLIVIGVIVWRIMKKKKSMYTYKYSKK